MKGVRTMRKRRKTRILISMLVMLLLMACNTALCYAECIGMIYINADGTTSSAPQEVVDQYNNFMKTKNVEAASLYAANAVGTPAGPGYAIPGGHDLAYYNSVAAATKSNASVPAASATNDIIKATQILAAQQKALTENPNADPAAIYLQTLQANGYTLDVAGEIVPIAK